MKIKNLIITILMTIFLIILGTKVEATTGTINEDAVKLRKQPDSKIVLDLVNKGDEVEILEVEEGWYKVKATTQLGKVTGYISNDEIDVDDQITSNIEGNTNVETPIVDSSDATIDVQETTPVVSPEVKNENIEEKKEYILQQELGIKALPLMSSTEKGKISGNIKIIEIINDWARVETDAKIGWIRINKLKEAVLGAETTLPDQPTIEDQPIQEKPVEEDTKVEEKPVEEQPVEPEKAPEPETTDINKTGYVITEGLRVRKGPSTDTEEITSLSKNDEVKIIGQTGKWYKIDLNGKIGYVSAKYISDVKLPETTSRSGSSLQQPEINIEDTEQAEENSKVDETPVVEKTEEPEISVSRTTGTAVVEYAKQYLGYKYVSGGTSPSRGFDCSGFTQYVYKHFGISINRSSKAQINNGVAVEKADLQPGDLVLFNNDSNTAIGHVGIYVGDGNFIHASNPSDGVKITTLTSGYYHKRYVGARRVI